MVHIAIMKKSWGMIPKILSGEKTIESRWYLTKSSPWDKIKVGEKIYFKDSGEPISTRGRVSGVRQYSDLTPQKIREILNEFGKKIGVDKSFFEMVKNKKYGILVFLRNPKKIKPVEISKKGFGAMSSWISVQGIEDILKRG